jgi:hypothetical protein
LVEFLAGRSGGALGEPCREQISASPMLKFARAMVFPALWSSENHQPS